jgi:hypothetical protein
MSKYLKQKKKKTGCRMVFDFIGTQIINSMPTYLANLPLPLFKKHITHWLMYECNVTKYD